MDVMRLWCFLGKKYEADPDYLLTCRRIITVIPNLAGVLGSLQKALDRSVYDVHVPLDRLRVAGAHREAGLEVIRCDYFLFANFCVLNVENWRHEIGRASCRERV